MKKIVDQINDAFIKVLAEEQGQRYARYVRAINREIIDNVDNLTPQLVKNIIASQKINIDDMVLLFAIQNAILILLNKPSKKEKQSLLPIVALVGMYSLRKPEKFVRKIADINKGRDLSDREKEARKLILGFKQDNARVLEDARRIARGKLDESIAKSKISKRILKDVQELQREGRSIKEIKSTLVKEYNNLSNIERALDTELHAQAEYVRTVHSKALGYTHKTWKTQNDKRVRKTCFHSAVKNQRVEIDQDFRACGSIASYPGDGRLPIGERVRCRCYLIYD